MSTKLLQVSPYSPIVMRAAHTLAENSRQRELISNAFNTTEEFVFENLAGLLNQLDLEKNGLSIFLTETGGDVELSVTILAHLLDISPSDLLARHSNELDRGRRVSQPKSTVIYNMLKPKREFEVPSVLLDVSNLLKVDHEEVARKLEELAIKLEQEEDAGKVIKQKITNPVAQAVILARLSSSTVPDIKVRHPGLFPDISIEDYMVSRPQPQLQLAPQPQTKRVAVATAVQTGY